MAKIKNRRRSLVVLLLLAVLFILYSAVGERGLIRLNRMYRQRDELRTRVRHLEQSNVRLAGEISRLRDDPDTIEALARTELGMVREGETVFILPMEPGASRK